MKKMLFENRFRSFSEEDKNVWQNISYFLTEIGIPRNYSGHVYFTDALFITRKHPEKIHHITKEIYPEIAEYYGITPDNVERNMRHALEIMWEKENFTLFPGLFTYSSLKYESRPTNSEFIAAVTELIDFSVCLN